MSAFDIVQQILGARGALSDDDEKRLDEVSRLFGLKDGRKPMRSPGIRLQSTRPSSPARPNLR
jgi:hypothetical protein